MSRAITAGYIRGFTDGEGTISKAAYAVYIYNTDLEILEKMSSFLNEIEIKSSIEEVKRKNQPKAYKKAYVLRIKGIENLVKFHDKIGLSITSKSNLLIKRIRARKNNWERLKIKKYNLLYDLYWNQHLSTYEIEEKTNINAKTIAKWMAELEIPRRTKEEINKNTVLRGRWKGRWK